MSATDVVGILVTTFILGSIYGLVAIGMSLIYGALRILDMSQGSMVMIGSFVGWGVLVVAGWNPLVDILLAFAATYGVVVYFTQFVAWGGIWSLYEQHAFLLPVPFFSM